MTTPPRDLREDILMEHSENSTGLVGSIVSRLFSSNEILNQQPSSRQRLTLSLSHRGTTTDHTIDDPSMMASSQRIIHALRRSFSNTNESHEEEPLSFRNTSHATGYIPESPFVTASDWQRESDVFSIIHDVESQQNELDFNNINNNNNVDEVQELGNITTATAANDLTNEAERVRLTTLSNTIDIRQIVRSVEGTLPFLVLLLIVFFVQHIVAIAIFACGTVALQKCNVIIRNEVAKKEEMKKRKLIACGMALLIMGEVVGRLGLGEGFLKLLLLYGEPLGTDFWNVLFTVILADLFIRLILAFIKSVIIAITKAESASRYKQRNGLLSALDYSTGVIRSVVPMPLWLTYFKAAQIASLLSMALSGLYLVVKAANVIEKASLAVSAMSQWRGISYGKLVSLEDLQKNAHARGSGGAPRECPICQDAVKNPLQLHCHHVFCEACIAEWMERDQSTCPMCRKVVQKVGLKSKSDGSTSLMPIIC